MNASEKLPALDGLRGVAILMVVFTHCGSGWQAADSITQDTLAWPATFHLPNWLNAVAVWGVHGVALFFVVSAFTLTLSLSSNRGGLLAYALRLVARVGPGYWLAGIAYTLAAGLAPRLWAPDGVAPHDLAVAALFGSAWQGNAALAVVPGGWSVSCEVTFYVALPILLWLIAGRLWRATLLTAAAAVGVQIVARHLMWHNGWHWVPQYINPGSQAPVFLVGILAAMVAQRFHLPRVPGLALVLLAAAIIGVPLIPVPHALWFLLPHLPFAALVAACVALSAQHPPRLLAHPAMRLIGEVSYSIYLIHFAVLAPSLIVAQRLLPDNNWLTLALYVVLTAGCSLGLACVTYRWVEQPCIEWARRVLRTRRPDYGAEGRPV